MYIAAATYITSIVLAVIVVSTYTLMDYVNTYPAVVGNGILLGTTMILGLVFIPRVRLCMANSMYFKPKHLIWCGNMPMLCHRWWDCTKILMERT